MGDRFVSGGTISSNGEATKDADAVPQTQPAKTSEWEIVQRELEAERRRREEARVKLATGGEEKSLYDVLQANKAAKEAVFEEQNKLKNQFRALDDDEIDFLDEVKQKQRAEEEKVKKEMEEGLKAFRERQKGEGAGEAEADDVKGSTEEPEEAWGVGRKRKRVKEKEKDLKGLRRRVGDGEAAKAVTGDQEQKEKADEAVAKKSAVQEKPKATNPPVKEKKALALVDYGSDDSDND